MSTSHEHGSQPSHESHAENASGADLVRRVMDQAAADRWQEEGARLGKRRVRTDVSRQPDEAPRQRPESELRKDAFISSARPDALDDAYRIRREESMRIVAERQDFAAWESQLASSNLETAMKAVETLPGDHERIETPEGIIETDTVELDDEIRIVLAVGESAVVEREEIIDIKSGEHHVVETSMTEEGTEVTIDGQPVEEEDLPKVEALNDHIVELIDHSSHEAGHVQPSSETEPNETDPVKTPEEVEPEEPQEQTPDTPSNRGKGARNFFQAMSANPGIREHLARTLSERNTSKEQFNEMLEKATDADMTQMRALFNEAGPKSSIWMEHPGPSALGRASKVYRDKLNVIINDIIER